MGLRLRGARAQMLLAAGTSEPVRPHCAACHSAAAGRFDFVCGKTHGCTPLPLTDAVIAAVQRGDPRLK